MTIKSRDNIALTIFLKNMELEESALDSTEKQVDFYVYCERTARSAYVAADALIETSEMSSEELQAWAKE